MTWNGIVYFLRGDDGDYDDPVWDSLCNPSIPVQGRIVWELEVF